MLDKNAMTIVHYNLEHQPYFEKFHRDWVGKYFWMEAVDEFVFTDLEEAI